METEIVANVSPRSLGAHSLFAAPEPITAANVANYHSSADDMRDAERALTKMGFTVAEDVHSETFLTISGSPKLFREVFGAKLKKQKVTVAPGSEVEVMATGDEVEEQVLDAPSEFADLIEGITIPRPPEFFAPSPLPPLAPIQPNAYRYLFLPDEVAVISRAARVHRLGVTGKDVVVGMADTGMAPHPFFNWRGYRVLATLLGPGASDPGTDPVGHGAVSANVFANAPDCRLRPLKLGNDTAGAIATLVNSTPKPQVLTNSWGYHIDHPNTSLPAWLVPLAAAVADAVANGITVLFSAGNGHRAFPASHRDAIAIGGVHVTWPDLELEASNYASSFVSSFYPGRRVPDLCGLTGRRVVHNSSGFAPSIMHPVPPGSQLDGVWPPTGEANDAWGLFSGTSAACPQVAGICALLLEKDPTLTPATIKQKLVQGARDVTAGQSAMGDAAGPGNDLATGAGLADAKWSYIVTMGEIAATFLAAPKEQQVAMMSEGRMPQVSREFIDDMIDTLRSR